MSIQTYLIVFYTILCTASQPNELEEGIEYEPPDETPLQGFLFDATLFSVNIIVFRFK